MNKNLTLYFNESLYYENLLKNDDSSTEYYPQYIIDIVSIVSILSCICIIYIIFMYIIYHSQYKSRILQQICNCDIVEYIIHKISKKNILPMYTSDLDYIHKKDDNLNNMPCTNSVTLPTCNSLDKAEKGENITLTMRFPFRTFHSVDKTNGVVIDAFYNKV